MGIFHHCTVVLLFVLAIYRVIGDTTEKKYMPEAELGGISPYHYNITNRGFNSMQDNSSSVTMQPDYNLTGMFKKTKKDELTKLKIPLKYAKGSSWGMVGEIRVGYEGKQPFDVMFDTQSSNMLMFDKGIKKSSKYTKRLFNRNNRFYNHKKSLMAHGEVSVFDIKYPDGSIYGGGWVHDSVWLGRGSSHMFYTSFAWVDYMNKAAAKNRGGRLDGIVGLGSPGFVKHKNTGHGHKALLDLLINVNNIGKRRQKQIPCLLKKPVFSLYVSKTGKTGELMLGGHNERLLTKGYKMVYFQALRESTLDEVEEDWENLDDSVSDDEMSQMSPADHDIIIINGMGGGGQRRGRRTLPKPRLLVAQKKTKEGGGESIRHSTKKQDDVVWGIKLDKLEIGREVAPIGTDVRALLCSTVPHGIQVPSLGFMERIVESIGHGAQLTQLTGEIIIGCDQLESNSLPALTLTIQEKTFEFTPKEYFTEVVPAKQSSLWDWWRRSSLKAQDKVCRSFFGTPPPPGEGEVARPKDDEEGPVTIKLGIPFMKKYYTEYDYGVGDKAARIGIALSKGVEIKYKSTKKSKLSLSAGFGVE